MRVDRDQVVAFRLAAHNLIRRLPPGRLAAAARPVGVQDSRVDSAALSLAARAEGVDATTVAAARADRKRLITIWAVRGAPYVVPVADLAVFTVGAMPTNRQSFDTFLGGWAKPIADAGLSPFDLLGQMARVARVVLDGRDLPVDDLRHAIYDRVPALHRVRRPASARADMPEPLFRALGLTGEVCITDGEGTNASIGLTEQWLGGPPPPMGPEAARSELVRRFLHAYGPATEAAFAEWTNRSRGDASQAFALVTEELAAVDAGAGGTARLLSRDVDAVRHPPVPTGVRLLPPLDPFLQQRDRATLVTDPALRGKVWRPVGPPGAIVADGRLVATWRARKTGRRLEIAVEELAPLTDHVRSEIRAEAERVAPARSCSEAMVAF